MPRTEAYMYALRWQPWVWAQSAPRLLDGSLSARTDSVANPASLLVV